MDPIAAILQSWKAAYAPPIVDLSTSQGPGGEGGDENLFKIVSVPFQDDAANHYPANTSASWVQTPANNPYPNQTIEPGLDHPPTYLNGPGGYYYTHHAAMGDGSYPMIYQNPPPPVPAFNFGPEHRVNVSQHSFFPQSATIEPPTVPFYDPQQAVANVPTQNSLATIDSRVIHPLPIRNRTPRPQSPVASTSRAPVTANRSSKPRAKKAMNPFSVPVTKTRKRKQPTDVGTVATAVAAAPPAKRQRKNADIITTQKTRDMQWILGVPIQESAILRAAVGAEESAMEPRATPAVEDPKDDIPDPERNWREMVLQVMEDDFGGPMTGDALWEAIQRTYPQMQRAVSHIFEMLAFD